MDNNMLSNLYEEIVKQFIFQNNIKEVTCTDTKEHFFDKIVNNGDNTIKVYNHGFTNTTWSSLLFDFNVDYATCLAYMEHDLFMQQRNGKHNKYNFIFNK